MSLVARITSKNQVFNLPAVIPSVLSTSQTVSKPFQDSEKILNLVSTSKSLPRKIVVKARGAINNKPSTIKLNFTCSIGQGTFGQIEKATLTYPDSSHTLLVAVKRVLQDPKYKNRELNIMQKINTHPNFVKFYYYYFTCSSSKSRSCNGKTSSDPNMEDDVYLELVLECLPCNLSEMICMYSQQSMFMRPIIVKLFTYQMLKALAYLHSFQICHRDIKSSNLLVDESTMVLKLCDFGSAKEIMPRTTSVSYISSRYYRAPELLFGAQLYTCAIDVWSAGCVLAEMLRQNCLFMGSDSVDQLAKVIRVLGTPSAEDIASMNPMYETHLLPSVPVCPVTFYFPRETPHDLLAIMSQMLIYNPARRLKPEDGLKEACFDELRAVGRSGNLPGNTPCPVDLCADNPPPSLTRQQQPDQHHHSPSDLAALEYRQKGEGDVNCHLRSSAPSKHRHSKGKINKIGFDKQRFGNIDMNNKSFCVAPMDISIPEKSQHTEEAYATTGMKTHKHP